jgi:hypothetical protein
MEFWKRKIPLVIVFIAGITMIVTYYNPQQWSDDVLGGYSEWYQIILAFSYLLGMFSLIQVHLNKIAKQRSGWGFSVVMMISFLIMATVGFVYGIDRNTPFMWVFHNAMYPLSATIFSMLAFYIASAAYRAFRARSFEAGIMLVTAVIVMIGRIPFGESLSSLIPDSLWFLKIDYVAQWLFLNPIGAAKRAIVLGMALSAVTMALRIILGLERTYLGSE